MSFRLLISEPLPAPGMRVLEARPDVVLDTLTEPTDAALTAGLPAADGLIIVLERPRLTAEMIRVSPRLRIACRCGAGYDNFDLPALTRRRIPLATTGAANADTVAEHALYLMLALAKKGPLLDRQVRQGGWTRAFGATELRDRTCLVVGYGHIGLRVARLAAAFSMHVVVVDPHKAGVAARDGHACAASLDEALGGADFVVLACPLTPATRGLIDAGRLRLMKRSAVLVNVARGGVVDEAALVAALGEKRIAGAGLDVLETEPPRADNPLLAMDNVVLTPHSAAFIDTAYDRMAIKAAENALAGLDGRSDPADLVNPEVLGSGHDRQDLP